MAYEESITLVPYLKAVPDTRHAQGKQYELWVLLTILCAALLSGQKTVWGIVEWSLAHAGELIERLALPKRRIPSCSTFYVTLRKIGVAGLERQLAEMGTAMEAADRSSQTIVGADGQPLRGLAADGKELRGALAHGDKEVLVSLAGHGDGLVLGQAKVDVKTNEITVVPQLLAGRDLHGVVITTDAMHTQRALAQQILDQRGDYLMIVKQNQPELYASIDLLFQSPPLCPGEEDRLTYTTHTKAHGRRETRTLETSAKLNAYVDWPGAQQVLRRTYHAVDLKTGEVVHKVTYGITSLSRERALPKHIAALRRGHWTIENRDHYVRDETLGEDRCQLHTGNSAQALAALRNAVLNLLRYQGWSSIPAALRHYGASLHKALTLLGVPAP
jgi:predicted transposase YbfD/YdcC